MGQCVVLLLMQLLSAQLLVSAAVSGVRHAGQPEREADGAAGGSHYVDGVHNPQYDHQKLFGNRKDVEDYVNLKPEEAKQRLGELFVLIDKDKDDSVSREELGQWIENSMRRIDRTDSDDRFAESDRDNDGKVSWSEYLHDNFDVDQESELDDNEDEQKLLREDKLTFDAADIDKDGSLNSEEFFAFSYPESVQRMHDVVVKLALLEKDTNGDGAIDFSEFAEDGDDKERSLEEKEKFTEYDKDGDGVLSGDEILPMHRPTNQQIAMDEVEHLISSCDGDHDGFLSKDEVLENYGVFAGSEATDYGDHLENIASLRDEL